MTKCSHIKFFVLFNQANALEVFFRRVWLSVANFHFLSPLAALPCILCCSPSPVFVSYSLNRLAHCQSRGLLWLRHKSARKNRNHLFKSRPECGWVYKYRSLGLTPVLHTDAHMTRRSSYGFSRMVHCNEEKKSVICWKLQSVLACSHIGGFLEVKSEWKSVSLCRDRR